ncbi:MAG: MATE family efflux transporter [Erysipelotrichaceae bacterium]|nr:MATE family efflux transporter [Erysipelotrichaceae bacterium]MBR6958273.1 MATE family efflux transporter [Erysipelotrichaceae bacterium]
MDKKKFVDLTEGVVWKQLLRFVWPITLANLFQQLYGMTNSMIVGNYMSSDALSSVSSTQSICNIASFFFYGISTACGILVSNYHGARDKENLRKTIHTGLVMGVAVGVIITVLGEIFCDQLMGLTNIRDSIYENAEIYLRVYMLGNAAVFLYNISFFIMRSLGDSRDPLYYLMISSVMNVVLGIAFVKYLNMGVVGTALASIISQLLVDVLAIRALFRMDPDFRMTSNDLKMDMHLVRRMMSLGIPASIQNMLIALSNMVVQSQVNLFSNEFIAGVGVAEKVATWTQIPMQSISTIGTSYVGQNLGARKYDRVHEGIRICNRIATIITIALAAVIFIFAETFVGLFNDNPEVIRFGATMTRYSVFGFIPLTWSHIYNGCCRGAGNMKVPMIIAVFAQCVFKFVFVTVGLKIKFDVIFIYLATTLSFALAGVLATIYFHTSKWTKEAHLRP